MSIRKFLVSGVACLLGALLALNMAQTQAVTYNAQVNDQITQIIASSGNVAAATATATITNTSTVKVAYLEGFDVTSSGSTGAGVVTITVTGSGATQSYTYTSIAGATLANPVLSVRFPTPIPASAANTNFVVSMPSLGAGNTNATVVAYGFIR